MSTQAFCGVRFSIPVILLSITGFALNSFTIVGLTIGNAGSTQQGLSRTSQAGTPPTSWRGIVPLCSTRADVEKLLGKPISSGASSFVYDTNEEQVTVIYSAGKCVLSGSERWNVPFNVVITIELRPKKPILIQDLLLDPNKYPRLQESHPENWFLYRNKEDGVMIETVLFANEEHIDSISYFPTIKDNSLRCSMRKL